MTKAAKSKVSSAVLKCTAETKVQAKPKGKPQQFPFII